MEFFKGKTAESINYAFQTLLVTYLGLLLIEQLRKGFVSNYMNLNYLLNIVIIAGVASVFSEQKKPKKEKVTKKDYLYIAILAIAGFLIIKFKTGELGWLSWLISIVAAALIALLSILILEEDEEKPKKQKEFEFTKKSISTIAIATIGSLLTITIALTFFGLAFLESARIVFGSVYVLFLPGFIMTFIFFPKITGENGDKNGKGIDWLERVALSFALSIAVVPLVVFYLNLIGLKINALSVSLVVLLIILIEAFILWIRRK